MNSGRVGVSLRQQAEFVLSTFVLLRPQTALCQYAVQFIIVRLSFRCHAKLLDGFGELFGTVVAEPQQCTSLQVVGLSSKHAIERRDGPRKVAQLKFSQTEV